MTSTNVQPGQDEPDFDPTKCSYLTLEQMDSSFPDKTFNLLSLNVRSLSSCFNDLNDLIAKVKTPFSVIALQEVWSTTKNFTLPGFHPLQSATRDSCGPVNPNCGGGVGIFVSSDYDFEPLPQLNCFVRGVYESIWILISDKVNRDSQKFIVGNIYRPDTPPRSNLPLALTTHHGILNKISQDKQLRKCKLFVLSDFNLDLNLFLSSDAVNDYVNDQASFGLSSVVSISAHPTSSSSKIIDHVFTSVPPSSIMSGVLMEHLSDHLPIVVADLSSKLSKQLPPQPPRDYSKSNTNSYLTLLKSINFVVDEDNVKSAFDSFFSLITAAAELAFPFKLPKSKAKAKTSPWMSKGLLASAKIKRTLFIAKLKSPSPLTRKRFQTYNKIFSKCKKMAKQAYYLSCFSSALNNTQKTWSLIGEVTGREKSASSLPSSFTIPTPSGCPPDTPPTTSSDPATIANGFNTFFGTIGPTLASNIDQSRFPGNHYSNFLGPKPETNFSLSPVTLEHLFQLVKNLKNKSSSGADHMSNQLLKKAIFILANPLKTLFDLSFKTGFVPDQMTVAKVIPLHKEGEKTSFNNYRPIAIISTIGKLMEKVVHRQLYDYLESQEILTKSQFGFRSHHGVEHPLLLFTDRVRKSLDKGRSNISVFIDLKKAFDTVNYDILLAKLSHYGIKGSELLWFRNYLKRKQYVLLAGNIISDIFFMMCGIPQGTVLGPLLFLIFVNDFAFATTLLSLLFADDCTLQGEGVDIPSLISHINKQLVVAEQWFSANLLTLNVKKTKYVIFQSSPPSYPLPSLPPLTIGAFTLDRVGKNEIEKTVRFLGVLIDEQLLFKEHIAILKKKLNSGLFALSSAKHSAPLSVRRCIYFSLFESHLRYGALLYGCAGEKDLGEITILQKKAIRHVAGAFYLAHTEPLFQSLKILKFQDLVTLERCVLAHKFKHNKLPDSFFPDFLSPISLSEMSRRQDPECYAPLPNFHHFTPRSPTSRIITSWNALPHPTKLIGCYKAFKADIISAFLLSYSELCSLQNCKSCGL